MKQSKKKVKASKKSVRLTIILNIKKSLSEVSVTDVAKRLGWSRQNVYKHLDENNADHASIPHLTKISNAIVDELNHLKEQEQQLAKTI